MYRLTYLCSLFALACFLTAVTVNRSAAQTDAGLLVADDGLLDDDDAATVTGDVLESTGDLARGLGKNALLRSLSAKQLQAAIDKRLDNREERVEMYYDLQDMREEELEQETISPELAEEIAESRAPNRLSDRQFDPATGEIFWPRPLDDKVLKPYRKPIEETLAKRSSPGEKYSKYDYFKVQRMVNLIREAVDSIEKQLDTREVVALKGYLDQIAYEARFNANGERVDY